jgi:hypothetical protein
MHENSSVFPSAPPGGERHHFGAILEWVKWVRAEIPMFSSPSPSERCVAGVPRVSTSLRIAFLTTEAVALGISACRRLLRCATSSPKGAS